MCIIHRDMICIIYIHTHTHTYIYINHVIIRTVLFVTVSRDERHKTANSLSLRTRDARRNSPLDLFPFFRTFFRTMGPKIRTHRCRVTINLHLAGYPYLLYGSDRPDAAAIISRRNYLPSAVNCTCTLCDTISSYDMARVAGRTCRRGCIGLARAYKRAKTGKLAVESPCKNHRAVKARRSTRRSEQRMTEKGSRD